MPSIYGITGQQLALAPVARPAGPVVRIVGGRDFWKYLHAPWLEYQAAIQGASKHAVPPMLGPASGGIYVTDPALLQGCNGSADYAARLSLPLSRHQEIQFYGCAVIQFDPPPAMAFLPPHPHVGGVAGLTAGGAREWILGGNLALDSAMIVRYVLHQAAAGKWYEIPLA